MNPKQRRTLYWHIHQLDVINMLWYDNNRNWRWTWRRKTLKQCEHQRDSVLGPYELVRTYLVSITRDWTVLYVLFLDIRKQGTLATIFLIAAPAGHSEVQCRKGQAKSVWRQWSFMQRFNHHKCIVAELIGKTAVNGRARPVGLGPIIMPYSLLAAFHRETQSQN